MYMTVMPSKSWSRRIYPTVIAATYKCSLQMDKKKKKIETQHEIEDDFVELTAE
jgi:hypothetical protein